MQENNSPKLPQSKNCQPSLIFVIKDYQSGAIYRNISDKKFYNIGLGCKSYKITTVTGTNTYKTNK